MAHLKLEKPFLHGMLVNFDETCVRVFDSKFSGLVIFKLPDEQSFIREKLMQERYRMVLERLATYILQEYYEVVVV